jgi:putative tricarboxylic transport membrane protein
MIRNRSWMLCTLSLAAFALSVALPVGPAQAWEPTEPVKIVVHTPAGTGSDIVARAVADIIRKDRLMPVAVEVLNRTGAGGLNAMTFTAAQKGNPHYLMGITNAFLSTPLMQKSALTFNDFVMVRIIAEDSNAIQVNANSRYNTLQDLVNAAKARPKAVSLGVGSIGGTDHMIGYRLGQAVGADFNVVSFDGGGNASVALMGNHIDFVTGGPSESRGQIDAGRLRVLAVLGKERLKGLPNVPSLGELGVDIGATFAVIRGFVAPPETRDDVAEYYSQVLDKVAATAAWKDFELKSDFVPTNVRRVDMKAFLEKRNSDIAETLKAIGVLK